MKPILTHNLGFPWLGENGELRAARDAYVMGQSTRAELEHVGSKLRRRHWRKQLELGIDWVPCGDFSFCDPVLDTTCMLGNIPERFGWRGVEADLDTRFALAAGIVPPRHRDANLGAIAPCETATWFDGVRRYVVPEFEPRTAFSLASWQVIKEFNEAGLCGIGAKPVLLGPVSYLTLGSVRAGTNVEFTRYALLEQIVPIYAEVLRRLSQWGAEWVQLDEPVLSLQLSPEQRRALEVGYARLKEAAPRLGLLVANCFGTLGDNVDLACNLACDGLHIDATLSHADATHAVRELETVAQRLPSSRVLSLGIVDGRCIDPTNLDAALHTITAVRKTRPSGELWLAPSCSLDGLTAPLSCGDVTDPADLYAIAADKLTEVNLLRELAEGKTPSDDRASTAAVTTTSLTPARASATNVAVAAVAVKDVSPSQIA